MSIDYLNQVFISYILNLQSSRRSWCVRFRFSILRYSVQFREKLQQILHLLHKNIYIAQLNLFQFGFVKYYFSEFLPLLLMSFLFPSHFLVACSQFCMCVSQLQQIALQLELINCNYENKRIIVNFSIIILKVYSYVHKCYS